MEPLPGFGADDTLCQGIERQRACGNAAIDLRPSPKARLSLKNAALEMATLFSTGNRNGRCICTLTRGAAISICFTMRA